VTLTQPVVPSTVATSTAVLGEEQWRVTTLLQSVATRGRWDAELSTDARWRLLRRGHFPEYAAELDWTPREVAGHLHDSARIFTARIRRMLGEDLPRLPDFVTDAPERLAGYRCTPPAQLVDELRTAQAALLSTVAALGPADLEREGLHELEGRLSVSDVVAFLPAHQRDHADQLAALLGR
jgi:hypothetical protein